MLRDLTNTEIKFFLLSLILAGCAPSFHDIKLRDADSAVPGKYDLAQTKESEKESTNALSSAQKTPTTTSSASINWKDFFKDKGLTSLIEIALKKNQELSILEQEILISKNEIMAREGEYLPKVSASGGAGIEKVGKYTSQGASDAANGVAENLPNLSLGLSASWEVDVWGKLHNAAKAALYEYLASVEGRNFMVTHLVAEIAESYYELMALHKKVEILEQNIELQERALEIVRLQKKAARVTELAVKRFEAEVLKNQSRRYALKQQIIEKENQLNFLAGRFPQPIGLDSTDLINLVPKTVESGVPSQLLENRPDVKQAELELKAAKLDVDVAKARFYPSISIEAGLGYQSFNSKYLFTTPDSMFYNLAANLTVPLLNRKGIEADYLSAGSKQLQSVYHFERTILTAYTDVENQLNRVENLRHTFELKTQQVEMLNASISISDTLFKAARCDYMEVLLTRRDALEAQMELVEVKQEQLSAVVNLYQALGGGWKEQ